MGSMGVVVRWWLYKDGEVACVMSVYNAVTGGASVWHCVLCGEGRRDMLARILATLNVSHKHGSCLPLAFVLAYNE